jgi:phosphatidylinositol glycan class A protein
LFVVSTRVGGLPEVLPPDMIAFGAPNAHDMLETLFASVQRIHTHTPWCVALAPR